MCGDRYLNKKRKGARLVAREVLLMPDTEHKARGGGEEWGGGEIFDDPSTYLHTFLTLPVRAGACVCVRVNV